LAALRFQCRRLHRAVCHQSCCHGAPRPLLPTKPQALRGDRLHRRADAPPESKDQPPRAESIEYGRASSTWARRIAKSYGADPQGESPLICSRCGNSMRVLAAITDPSQVDWILRHLINIGRALPGLICAPLHGDPTPAPATLARAASPRSAPDDRCPAPGPLLPFTDPPGPGNSGPRTRPEHQGVLPAAVWATL